MCEFIKLKRPIKYLITKGNLTKENYSKELAKTLHSIESATENGISLIQIREKKLPAKFVFELVQKALEIAKTSRAKILVNDRFDLALAAKADGVHLTSNSIPTSLIRRHTPKGFIIGVSTHSFDKAEEANKDGADFITYSPIFPTDSKILYGEPKGLNKLKEICEKLRPFPVIALGGINANNYEATIECGASGFAGIRFFLNN